MGHFLIINLLPINNQARFIITYIYIYYIYYIYILIYITYLFKRFDIFNIITRLVRLLGVSPICRWLPLRQPTIVFRREKSLEASVAPPPTRPAGVTGPAAAVPSVGGRERGVRPACWPTLEVGFGNLPRAHGQSQDNPWTSSPWNAQNRTLLGPGPPACGGSD